MNRAQHTAVQPSVIPDDSRRAVPSCLRIKTESTSEKSMKSNITVSLIMCRSTLLILLFFIYTTSTTTTVKLANCELGLN